MDRRGFLGLLTGGLGGIALEQAIPFGRVWSFPKHIVVPQRLVYAGLDYGFDEPCTVAFFRDDQGKTWRFKIPDNLRAPWGSRDDLHEAMHAALRQTRRSALSRSELPVLL